MSNYGLSSERAAAKYEAWLTQKPTGELWALLAGRDLLPADEALPADEVDFIGRLIASRADPDAVLREWTGGGSQ